MDSAFWLNLGIGGAVVVVVQLFLKHLRQERKACDRCRAEHHEVAKRFGSIVVNHMEHEIEAHERLTTAIRSLEVQIRKGVSAAEPSERGGEDVR